ncbi:MAG: hypothetical protein EXR93_00465 [Gemmatimonadetes bacterium]|nr:hypothetical protein [Gemmatimonadota bacterium]
MTEPQVHERGASRENADVSLLWILAVLVRERRLMIAFTLAGIVLPVTAALLRTRTYTTLFSFVLQSAPDPNTSGIASLVGQFGISLGAGGGLSRSPQFYADLVLTREVLAPIALDTYAVAPGDSTRMPLAKFLNISGADSAVVLERTVRRLRTSIIATGFNRPTGVVGVSIRTRSAQVSLGIAERLLQGLNHFNLVTRQSQAREERRFLEERVTAVRAELDSAQDAQRRFLERNRVWQNDPRLTLEMQQLTQEMQVRASVFQTVSESFEKARIDEVRNTPVITVIERPSLAARPNSRLSALILLVGTFAAFSVGVLIVLLRDAWRRQEVIGHDPAVALLRTEFKRIRGPASP